MDIFEHAIMQYVAADRSTFLIPQYDLERGWASLDFLGVNSERQIIHMMEVTTAANIDCASRKSRNV